MCALKKEYMHYNSKYLLINMHEVSCFVEITPPHIRTHFLARHVAICLHPILLPYLCNACTHHCHFDAYAHHTSHGMVCSSWSLQYSSIKVQQTMEGVDMFKWSISLISLYGPAYACHVQMIHIFSLYDDHLQALLLAPFTLLPPHQKYARACQSYILLDYYAKAS